MAAGGGQSEPSDMELRHLRYFLALAEELHFGRAALRLSITQPPLSFAIQAMEKEMDVRLFDRDNKRVSLTAAGKAYLAEARIILDRIEQANQTARSVAAGKLGRLDVGFTGSMVYRDVPQIVSLFLRQHPGIDVTLRELSSVEQTEALRHGHLHAGFVNTMSIPDGLEGQALLEDSFVCCLPAEHPYASRKEIDLGELSGEPFIMFVRDISPANYDNVIAICRRAGFEPRTRYAVRQWLTIVALVANGLGVSLVPASIARSGISGACFVPIRSIPAHSSAYLVWHPERRSPALDYFLEVASTVLARSDGRASSPVH